LSAAVNANVWRHNAAKNLEILRRFAHAARAAKPLRLHFLFSTAPLSILGTDRVKALRLTRTRGTHRDPAAAAFGVAVGTVVTAIGYRSAPLAGLAFDSARGVLCNEGGRCQAGV